MYIYAFIYIVTRKYDTLIHSLDCGGNEATRSLSNRLY